MRPEQMMLAASGIAVTVLLYACARRMYLAHRQHPLLTPVFLTGLAIAALLLVSGLGHSAYRPAGSILTGILGPVTVALALPVYRQRARLRARALPLLAGCLAGVAATVGTVLVVGLAGRLGHVALGAIAYKSVSAPIAVELARLHGLDPTLTAGAVIMTGILGGMFGPRVLSWSGVSDSGARGIGLGTVSHAIGTAAALAESESAGAMSSLAMIAGAGITACIVPAALGLVLHLMR